MLRIIIEHSSFNKFCPLSTRSNDSSYFGCKNFTFIFWHFVFSTGSSNVHPAQLTLSPIHNHKTKYENNFSEIGYDTHHTQKIMWFFQNVTMWLKAFKYTRHEEFFAFFFFWVWNFVQMWKINMKRKYLVTFVFEKTIIRFAKN